MSKTYKSICYCTNLRRSANAIPTFYDAQIKETGITISQYYLLINLSRLGNANISHWAEYVGLDRSTMIRNIKILQANELIVQTEGNGKTFMLSEKGNEVIIKAQPVWQELQEKIEAFLGKEDAEAILRIGNKLQGLN